ncbi:MAG: phosphate regulon sensor histidine kinase PhoR [Gammaproteobacteria bacterium]|nr:phosphate regulon sensor histidine kinase PhoR [Gammaproteobacteria bacterium]
MSPWSIEIRRLFLLGLLAWFVGNLLDLTGWMFALALAVYLTLQSSNLRLLIQWLQKNPDEPPPQGTGIWQEVFNSLYHRDKRQRNKIKQKERQLERYQESTMALPDATIILGRHGHIEWFSNKARNYLGLKNSDINQPIQNLIRLPLFVEYLAGDDYREPLEIPSPINNTKTLMIRIVPYGRSRRLLVARDMTRLQQLERMRRDFIANFSHELRTPMTVLQGYLEGMQDDPQLQKTWADSLNTMLSQVQRMENINNDLLYLSKLENPATPRQRTEVNIASLLHQIHEDAEGLSQGKHTITLQADNTMNLMGNEGELRSAFSNLVFNAVRYTPAGGQIDIRWYADEHGAYLEVKDNGEGIPTQHLSRLTERFYRVDAGRSRETGGTGLGLAIVKHVLNRHNAQLDITSQLDKGSQFCCIFPAKYLIHRTLS